MMHRPPPATVAKWLTSWDNDEYTYSHRFVSTAILSNFKAQVDEQFKVEVPPLVIEIPIFSLSS